MDLKVGQKVWVRRVENVARGRKEEVFESEINYIGKKYFTLSYSSRYKFQIHTLRQVTNYNIDYEIYLDKQDLLDKQEKEKKLKFINMFFYNYNGSKLSLNQLRKIHEIIEKGE